MSFPSDWTTSLARGVDILFLWILMLPRDLSLLLLAAGTALFMVAVRKWLTNQDLLRRCHTDLRKLKTLTRSARQRNDQEALGRLRKTIGQIKGTLISADLRVLVIVLIPVGITAIWAGERFDYLPPKVGDEILLRAYFPVSSIDRVTHLVAESPLQLTSPAVQLVRPSTPSQEGLAEWKLRSQLAGQYQILIRHHGKTAIHQLIVGQPIYSPPLQRHSTRSLNRTECALPRYLPLGLSFGAQRLQLPPWMIGYLLLTLALTPLLKKVLNVF